MPIRRSSQTSRSTPVRRIEAKNPLASMAESHARWLMTQHQALLRESGSGSRQKARPASSSSMPAPQQTSLRRPHDVRPFLTAQAEALNALTCPPRAPPLARYPAPSREAPSSNMGHTSHHRSAPQAPTPSRAPQRNALSPCSQVTAVMSRDRSVSLTLPPRSPKESRLHHKASIRVLLVSMPAR